MKRPSFPLALVAVFVLSFFWPGPYRYEEVGGGGGRSTLVRLNRFTGESAVFSTFRGWEVRDAADETRPPLLMLGAGILIVLAFVAGAAIGRRQTPSA